MPRRPPFALSVVAACVLGGTTAAPAWAQAVCPAGNVLERAELREAYDAYHAERITDGVVGPDGGHALSDRNALLTDLGRVVYELPRVTRIDSLVLQAEGNSAYRVSGSLDGEAWQALGEVPAVEGAGMRMRWSTGFELELRFLRVEPARGNGPFSIGELAAYCGVPDPWPPSFEQAAGTVRDEAWSRARERRLALGKLVYGLAGGAIVVGLAWARRRRRAVSPALERALLGMVVLAGGLSWINFGTFHGSNVWHRHELFHYVLGSKYFAENRYTRLYACAETAEAESGRRAFVERRVIRDLETNELVPASRILADPSRCTDAFSPDRWKEFARDVEFYRSRDYPGSWGAIFRDHGYNATPVWTLLGGGLVALEGLSRRPALLAAIDFALYASAFALLLWAFGLETTAIAALIQGAGQPWQYEWTGGAFARAPWFFLLVAALCLSKRARFAGSGAALAGSALLRLFPVLFAAGPVLRAAAELARHRRPGVAPRRWLAGAAVVLALLLPASAWACGGFGVWAEFFSNLRKHANSPLGNDVGLPVLFAWDASNTQAGVLTGHLDEFGRWEERRRETFAARRAFYLPVALAMVALFVLFVLRRAREDWEALAAGVLPVLALSELASYYLVLFVLLAPFAARNPARSALLAAAVVAGQVAQLAEPSVDTLYFVQSAILVVAAVALMGSGLTFRHSRGENVEM